MLNLGWPLSLRTHAVLLSPKAASPPSVGLYFLGTESTFWPPGFVPAVPVPVMLRSLVSTQLSPIPISGHSKVTSLRTISSFLPVLTQTCEYTPVPL